MQPTVATTGEQWMRQTERRIAASERRVTTTPYWDHAGAAGFVRASSPTSQVSGSGADMTYSHAEIVLGVGVWRVQAGASAAATAAVDIAVGVWDMGTGTYVPSSLGTAWQANAAFRNGGTSQPAMLRVSTTATLRIRLAQSGGATVTVSSGGVASSPAAWLQAERIQ